MVVAPADTLVYATAAAIGEANARNEGAIPLRHYDLVAKSCKKDLTDIDLAGVRDAHAGLGAAAVCFNRSFPAKVCMDPSLGTARVEGPGGSINCGAYAFRHMGLASHVHRSRLLHARQGTWREKGYKTCSHKDISAISNELLSADQPFRLEKFQ